MTVHLRCTDSKHCMQQVVEKFLEVLSVEWRSEFAAGEALFKVCTFALLCSPVSCLLMMFGAVLSTVDL